MGAAYLAGLAVGYWKSKEDVIKNQSIDQIFSPQMSEEDRQAKRKGWNKAVKYAYGWGKKVSTMLKNHLNMLTIKLLSLFLLQIFQH